MNNLATICKNDCQTAKDHALAFNTTGYTNTFPGNTPKPIKNIADNLNNPQ
jgi:hypothetical protein